MLLRRKSNDDVSQDLESRLKSRDRKRAYVFMSVCATLIVAIATFLGPEIGLPSAAQDFIINIAGGLVVLVILFMLRHIFLGMDEIEDIKTSLVAQNDVLEDLKAANIQENRGRAFLTREEYYEVYFKQLEDAKEKVLLIGDGFSFHDELSRTNAQMLGQKMREALNRGCKIDRYQFTNTLSLKWLEILENLNSRPGFRLFVDEVSGTAPAPYVLCVTDAGLPTATISLMFTVPSHSHTQGPRVGGPGMLFENVADLSLAVQRGLRGYFAPPPMSLGRLDAFRNRLKSRRMKSIYNALEAEEISLSLEREELERAAQKVGVIDLELFFEAVSERINQLGVVYFAYGSNLFTSRLEERVGKVEFLGCAHLHGYRLVFNIPGTQGEGEGGGIANLAPAEGRTVHGFLYFMRDGFSKLESIEHPMGYSTQNVTVQLKFGEVRDVKTFIRAEPSAEEYAPTQEYRELIYKGLRQKGIEGKYLSDLRAHIQALDQGESHSG